MQTTTSPGPARPSGADASGTAARTGLAEALTRASAVHGYRDVLDALGSALDDAATGRGSAVVVRGEPGSGKSTLLRRAADAAVAEGWQVFQICGVPGDAAPPFGALRSLAYPVLNACRDLPETLRSALLDTLAGAAGADDALLAYSGLRQLLLVVARRRPTLVIVDDFPWLDSGSAKALAYLAHRLTGSRLVLLAATGDDRPGPLDGNGTHELVLTGLDDRAAGLVLDDRHPDLAPRTRAAITAAAQGNPLLLVDLPSALTPAQRRGEEELPDPLPVGAAVARSLGGPFRELPTDTRVMLSLLDTAQGVAMRKDVLSAAGTLGIEAGALVVAERAGLVTGDQVLRFRTPVHRCLAASTAPPPVHSLARSAWADYGYARLGGHAYGPDDAQEPDAARESTVRRLDALAGAALRGGNWGAAYRALRHSGDVSSSPAHRGSRYVAAGAAALRAGRSGEALALIRDLPAAQNPAEAVRTMELVRACAEFDTVCQVGRSSVRLASALLADRGDGAELRDAAALRLAESGSLQLSPEPARIATNWLRTHPDVGGEPLRIAVAAHLTPVTGAAEIRERLAAAADAFHGTAADLSDPRELVWLADAALRIDEAGLAELLVTSALRRLDAGDRSRIRHCEALQADLMLTSGRWTDLRAFAEPRRARARREGVGRHDIDVTARLLMVHACQGRYEEAETLLDEVHRWGVDHGSAHHVRLAAHARHLLALGSGDTSPLPVSAGLLTSAVARRAYVDTVRSALTRGDDRAARELHQRASAVRPADVSAETATAVRHGAALLAAHEGSPHTDERFRHALDSAAASTRPFDRARLALDYGRWLRRQRETAAARTQLRAGQDVFARLGAAPWRDMALAELRAIGVSARDADPEAVTTPGAAFLSAQERRIAKLAAQGLSNRQIADQLFISPRTVGSHLYKVYPRLGVSSRRELLGALRKSGESA
ncbi:helix-turn-helix transcriptional regulator [Streptomyces longispororuber]|uniref:helix-turn-helix transcriptional regulator n=1 Tax=Streptomyces longispororuber TaxID=68230 RepID=UPI00210EF1BF|nr:LuxR family transcriptional regulator [Streptomyces longispororuber]MCQ4207695.1 AAA family ATPase [Streptomyces longispororuber]